MNDIKLLYIDLFCGAGGTSTGVERAQLNGGKCARVIACVNHDANAIASHAANHPYALHYTEDIRTLELSPMVKHVNECREQFPGALVVLWASLECTNFSRAKGGQPRDADSRTLAEHLYRYIEAINPDYLQIENVEEFMCWGDLDPEGKPISRHKGKSYMRWVKKVRSYGYDFDCRILNAADYGAYTSRKRYFGIFARNGLPIVWPTPTHSKDADDLDKWRPVREVLDLDDDGSSIFVKKKPLCERTLARIYAGLVKFVAGGKDAFLVKYNSFNRQGKYNPPGIDEPCPTVATQNRIGLAKVQFLSKQFSGEPYDKNISIEQPAGAITTKDHHAFISAYYGNGFNHSLDEPAPTITTGDRFAMVTSRFLDMQYGNGTPSSVESPAMTLTVNPKHQLVSCKRFLMNPYSFQSDGSSIDKPCFTLIARMDKMPPYLITTEEGIGIEVYESDSPMTVKIKEFMAIYCIVDIKMRMLNVGELKRIQGFPSDYVLIGTQAEQKKYIGNAVEVNMSRVLCEALAANVSKC
jgi:DNA (cytosine-5)-methyltransferase 1